jgi:hypothetical protein
MRCRHCERSEAIRQHEVFIPFLDSFVALLLAMTLDASFPRTALNDLAFLSLYPAKYHTPPNTATV